MQLTRLPPNAGRPTCRTTAAIVEEIYTDVPPFLHAAAGVSVEAHLRKLEREGRVECAADAWRAC